MQVRSWTSVITVTFNQEGQPKGLPRIPGRLKEAGGALSARSNEEASSDCKRVGRIASWMHYC